MARRHRNHIGSQFLSMGATAIGASDAQTTLTLTSPPVDCYLDAFIATTLTAGTGTGSFTVTLENSAGDDYSQALTIDPDGAANAIATVAYGNGTLIPGGTRLHITTTKTGTVSTGPNLMFHFLFRE